MLDSYNYKSDSERDIASSAVNLTAGHWLEFLLSFIIQIIIQIIILF